MEISKTECKRILRTLELKAYRSVVDALRAQGALTVNKHEVLKSLAATLKVSEERYRSEMRRAANDDLLNTIAQSTGGTNTEVEWRAESMKKVPSTPMIASHTAFTVLADAISDIVSLENEKFSSSSESNNVAQSFRCRNDENLEKYQSSKALDSLLKKRKNHHENFILSELETIKLNNNYHSSPIKSGYIEISYDDDSSTVDTQDQNFSFDDTSSSFDTATLSSFEKPNASRNGFSSENLETETFNSSVRRINSKSRSKVRRSEKLNENKISSSASKIQNKNRTRNLRTKPLKKYTWNSVEIRSFEDEDTDKTGPSKNMDNERTDDTSRDVETLSSETSKESLIETYHSENDNSDSLKNRRSKQRNRNRTNFIDHIRINRGQKLADLAKMNPDAAKEVPSRTGRFSSRNARRQNYARIASGEYDLLEFEKIRKEKKAQIEQIREEVEDDEEDEMKETDDDSLSDSSAAPIEISYSNPAAPKINDYDLDGVSSTYTETDDDMKPHTFNLIPASRRLKMMKKRAASPSGEETPSKQIALSSQSSNEMSIIPTTKASLLDANALKKVLGIHENSENVTSSSVSETSDVTDTKEILDASDRAHSEMKEFKASFLMKHRPASEKKLKPKMRLSEASTIENLHSLLSKVKEGDLKKLSVVGVKKKSYRKKKDRKSSPRSTSPIVNNCNGSLIEVGSDSGPVNDDNCEAVCKESVPNDPILSENSTSTDENFELNNSAQNPDNLLENETQIDEDVKPNNLIRNSENLVENEMEIDENVKPNNANQSSENFVENEMQIDENNEDSENLVENEIQIDENYEAQDSKNSPKSNIQTDENVEPNEIAREPESTPVDDEAVENFPKSDIETDLNVKQNDQVEKSENISVDEEVVDIAVDDLKEPAECNILEQLIDIESADIIIGDSGDQTEEIILTGNTFVSVSPINNLESAIEQPVESVIPPTTAAQTDENVEKKSNIVIINSLLQKDLGLLPIVISNQNSVPESRRPIIKKLLSESADFRYKADADDPSLKNSQSKPPPLVHTIPPAGVPTIMNSSKKIAKLSIPSVDTIIAKDSKTPNNNPNTTPIKINQSNITANSTFPKDRKFVLLDTKSIAGSKSLLKPIKIIPKIAIPTKTSTGVNCIIRKPNTMGIYSSLENLNKFAASPGSTTVKKVIVSKTGEIDPKRLVLSQALERSLKSIEITKNHCDTSVVNMSENIESSKTVDITENSSNDSHKDDKISILNEIETVFRSDEASASSNYDSESISSNEGLKDMKTFFSKNIVRKQS